MSAFGFGAVDVQFPVICAAKICLLNI